MLYITEAVELNDLAQLHQLLAAQIRPKPKEMTAALEIAIMKRSDKYSQCTQMLLEYGANPNGSNGSGTHFLHLAADADCHEILSILIKFKCDVNISREDGACAMHRAAWQGHTSSLQVLLNAGADITIHDAMRRTPLLVAAQENRTKVISMILASGGCVTTCDVHDRSVLYWMVYYGNTSLVHEVLSLGCINVLNQPGPDGVTPLILAAHTGNCDIVRFLIKAGAHLDCREDNGMTAIVAAARHDQFPCVRLLIVAGCDVNIQDAFGNTPLIYLLDQDELVKILLDAGADPNMSSHQNLTCLWLATSHKFQRSTKLLLQYNAHVDTRSGNDGNKLPLQTAMYGGSIQVVKMLFITSIAMATDLEWLCEYVKDDNFQDQAALNPDVSTIANWVKGAMGDFYKPREPLTLKATCRLHIKRHLGSRRMCTVHTLPLPGALKNYLKLQELDQYIF